MDVCYYLILTYICIPLSPQPFTIDEIRTCGATFPQPTSADRLYLDRTCFFGNITDEVRFFQYLLIFMK